MEHDNQVGSSEDGQIQSDTARIGDTLKAARLAREETLSDISKALLFREDYLRAIEDMYANGVPRGLLNGILRSYAQHLGLDADMVIREFANQCGAVSQAPKREAVIASNHRKQSLVRMSAASVAAAIALVIFGGVGFHLLSAEQDIAARTLEAGTPVNGARESLFASADLENAQPQLPLTLTAQSAAWLEVRGADGTIFRSRRMASGEVYHPRIGAGWTVSARNGAAFVWHVGDIEIGPLSETEMPVYAVSVDAVAVEAQARTAPALAGIGDAKPTR